MAFDELIARTADGVTLRIDRVRAEPRYGVVLCLHAMMTDGRYFGARHERSFAAELAREGLDVFVADLRGHGGSRPPLAGIDDWSFDDLVELDLPAIVAAVADAARCPAEDLVILGHSLGGLVATAAIGSGRIVPPHKLLLAATCAWLGGPTGPFARRALMAAYAGITALFGKAPIRAVRAGTADESATYVRQLTEWNRSGRWTSLRGVDYGAAAARITTPTTAFVGAGDWMCTPDDARDFARRIPTAGTVRVIGRAQGAPLDPDHFQLFTRPELTAMREWLITTARA